MILFYGYKRLTCKILKSNFVLLGACFHVMSFFMDVN